MVLLLNSTQMWSHIVFQSYDAIEANNGTHISIHGALIIDNTIGPGIPKLKIRTAHGVHDGTWVKRQSSLLKMRFPDALNSSNARFFTPPIPVEEIDGASLFLDTPTDPVDLITVKASSFEQLCEVREKLIAQVYCRWSGNTPTLSQDLERANYVLASLP